MSSQRILADLVHQIHESGRTGALLSSLPGITDKEFKIYFRDGNIYHMSYGFVHDRTCLHIFDCCHLSRISFYEGMQPADTSSRSTLPGTSEIISILRKTGTLVFVD